MPVLYPRFDTPYVVVPISVPFAVHEYASFPYCCVTRTGKKIAVFRNSDRATPADHWHNGAAWMVINNGTPVLKWTKAEVPDPARSLGAPYVMVLPDGNLIAIMSREPSGPTDRPIPKNVYATSTDDGANWSALANLPNPFEFPEWEALFFDFTPSRDGTKLLATAYGQEPGQSNFSCGLFESSSGSRWTLRSWIKRGAANPPYINETGLIRFPDGRLLGVARNTDGNKTGQVSISDDDGVTWSALVPLAAAPGYAMPLDHAGMAHPYLNWNGQRGFAANNDCALVFGRANATPWAVPGDTLSATCWYALDREGRVLAGPSVFDVIDPGHNGNWDGGYCAVSRAAGGTDIELWSYSVRAYVGSATYDVYDSSPAMIRWKVHLCEAASSYSLTPSSTSVARGAPLSITWTAPAGAAFFDWIGLFPVGSPNVGERWWNYTWGAGSGTYNLTAPGIPGQYEFRYLLNNTRSDVKRSSPITVS